MSSCCCSLAGTAACQTCSNNPFAETPPPVRTYTVSATDPVLIAGQKTDVAPVRHGRWLEIIEHVGPNRLRHEEIYAAVYRCSVCNEEAFDYDYCPNCGAKMDGEG